MSSTPSHPPRSRRRPLLLAAVVILLAGGATAGWYFWFWQRNTGPDAAALAANTRGIGHMDRFEYPKAAAAFEEVTRRARGWLPGRINLAIALLNMPADPASHPRAVALFREVLQQEPDNPYAHFCLGIILNYQGKFEEANPHFEQVTRIDPADPHAWFYRGVTVEDEAKQRECFEKAVELDPNLRPALFRLATLLGPEDPPRAKVLRHAHERKKNRADVGKDNVYGEIGKYAVVIGRGPAASAAPATGPVPLFRKHETFGVKLAAGARWAGGADFGKGAEADLRRRARQRFGATLVVLDFNRDDRPDLFLAGAVVEKGAVRDLLLRNDGDAAFTDVTAEAGLAESGATLGAAAADFDNDGAPDLFLSGVGRQRLLRNDGKGAFQDVTEEAGLGKAAAVGLGATFVDLDLDGDLDLVLADYAASAEEGLARLNDEGKQAKNGGGLRVFLNVGEAPAKLPSLDPPPLRPRFRPLAEATKGAKALAVDGAAVGAAMSDLDGDRDPDLVLLADGGVPAVVTNERLLRFARAPFREGTAPAGRWNGALVLDANHDERSDLFACGPGQPPVFLVSEKNPRVDAPTQGYQKGITNSPPLLQAQAIDLDYDGWTDVVGLSEERRPVFLQNDGRRLVHRKDTFGLDQDWPKDLIAVAAAELDGDKHMDLLVWSEGKGLELRRSEGNDNKALKLVFYGHRREESTGTTTWSNADGLGTWAVAQAGDFWTGAEYASLSAGLGQSLQPLALGLGPRAQADVVRLRWPDNCWQAEFNIAASRTQRIDETNRKETSCPVLFAWNGKRYEYVGDFLGAGTVGEILPGGSCRPPRPEESVKVEAGQLAPLGGEYALKVAEPMQEVVYLDRLHLLVTDLPPRLRAYPDERFTGDAKGPSQDLLVFEEARAVRPVRAEDHRGQNVTQALRRWDRQTVDGFARRAWVGYAEEHWLMLDFGDRLAKFGAGDRLVLFLAGWTDYPYPHAMWAAEQAGVPLLPPVLERRGPDGKWQPLIADMGFPAGTPRVMTVDLTGKVGGPSCVLRIRSNMHVFWDEVFVVPLSDRVPAAELLAGRAPKGDRLRVHGLPVRRATLEARGFMQEFSPDGKAPTAYDYHRLEKVPAAGFRGKLTRLGDVTELLREADDCFVIFGPGEEVDVRFDAAGLPPLPEGWTRSFVLRSWGFCKGAGPFTATGGAVDPLPFRAMSGFPYGPDEHYPRTPRHEEYGRKYNTREAGR